MVCLRVKNSSFNPWTHGATCVLKPPVAIPMGMKSVVISERLPKW